MTNLTPEEINRALAEWMGWKLDDDESRDAVWVCPDGDLWMLGPNFCEDLNNVATIEAKLTDEQHWKFRAALWEVTCTSDDKIDGELHNRQYASATALQKATALVRALGLIKKETE